MKSTYGRFPDRVDSYRHPSRAELSRAGGATARSFTTLLRIESSSVPIAANNGTIEPGAPIALFQTRIATPAITYRQQYDIAPDGRFLINETTEDAYTSPITLLLNWKPPTR
jgi:hypothetical protein